MLHMNLEDCFVHMGGDLHNYKLLNEKHEQQDEFILSRLGNLQVGAYYKFWPMKDMEWKTNLY
jgi:hypothetical protein